MAQDGTWQDTLPMGGMRWGRMDPALSGGHRQRQFRIYSLDEKILIV